MRVVFLALLALASFAAVSAAKDPKQCEVCIKVINDIKEAAGSEKNLEKIEGVLQRVCAGVTTTQEKKLCYYIEPIQREVSRPVSNGLPADKICTRLKKSSSEICSVMFAAPEAPIQEDTDLTKLTLKQLRQLLAQRGVTCDGCIEKSDFVRRAQETKGKKKEL